MSRNVGSVKFQDGSKLFLIFDGTVGLVKEKTLNNRSI